MILKGSRVSGRVLQTVFLLYPDGHFYNNTSKRKTTGSTMHLIIQSSNIFSITNIVIVKRMLDNIRAFYKFMLEMN